MAKASAVKQQSAAPQSPRNVPATPVARAIQQGLSVLAQTQHTTGSWKGDYGGPLFLLPLYVAAQHITGTPIPEPTREGMVQHLSRQQNPDGGWGLDVECDSQVFTTVLNYVMLRLLGVPRDDAMVSRARTWFLPHGGALGSASWGKFILAVLGVYDYRGLHPVSPELWLLPTAAPFHPSRMWCHSRMVYLPMSYLYGVRAQAADAPVLRELREELYAQPYQSIDWQKARDQVAATDVYTPHSGFLKVAHTGLDLAEKYMPQALRKRALAEVLEQVAAEDEATSYVCIGPVNKVYNTLVWHFAKPGGTQVKRHLERMPEYLSHRADGIRMNGYNSSELWDTAFAVQSIVQSQKTLSVSGGDTELAAPMLREAHRFIDYSQVRENTRDPARHYRHPSKGGWPFSTREHGWPISDCTAEGLKASLLLERLALDDRSISIQRQKDAVELMLSMQNDDGGWATYELIRGARWMEKLNPSDVFSDIMVELSYVECTSACLQALTAFAAAHPTQADDRLWRAVERGRDYILGIQRLDGSWEGSWGVCFTYGTWFGIWGLAAAGLKPSHPAFVRAAAFLRSHQLTDGGWGETIESCRQRKYVHAESGQAVMTSWALMALARCGERDSVAVRRGVQFLLKRQQPDGRWPEEHICGVFNKTCAIHYDAYLRIFPIWALSLCAS